MEGKMDLSEGEAMLVELEFGRSLCFTRTFVINGVAADPADFGDQFDHDAEHAEDYGCGDMRFDPKPETSEVLNKYSITVEEYAVVAGKLEEGLSFGACGLCV
jgi:hypothetical protein